ncbi:MAG: ImmA/IrrE family metallo-endopeptidase [Pseudonocardiaceae bacterium]
MTVTTNDANATSHLPLLTALRALAAEPNSTATMWHIADRQAQLVREHLLPVAPEQVAGSLMTLIPTLHITYVNDLPASGISFWARGQWHIHLRTGHRIELQLFTIMHEVKHIIDHPVRRKSNRRSGINWESLANHFAAKVLVIESVCLTKAEGGS